MASDKNNNERFDETEEFDGDDDAMRDDEGDDVIDRNAFLHVYAQGALADAVWIVGTRPGLRALHAALTVALRSGEAENRAATADGVEYSLIVRTDDSDGEGPRWQARRLPYTDPDATDDRPNAVWPQQEFLD